MSQTRYDVNTPEVMNNEDGSIRALFHCHSDDLNFQAMKKGTRENRKQIIDAEIRKTKGCIRFFETYIQGDIKNIATKATVECALAQDKDYLRTLKRNRPIF